MICNYKMHLFSHTLIEFLKYQHAMFILTFPVNHACLLLKASLPFSILNNAVLISQSSLHNALSSLVKSSKCFFHKLTTTFQYS